MRQMTSEGGLPDHGVERAAARVHQVVDAKRSWGDLDESAQQQYRATVRHILRDLAPEPATLNKIPLLWWSDSWGVLQAERANWGVTKLVHPVSFDRDLLMELPDDAVPMTAIQPCKPGKSLDDIRRPHLPNREQVA
jgi:hypothetical protein